MSEVFYPTHFKLDPDTSEWYFYRNGSFHKVVSKTAEPNSILITDENGLLPFKYIEGDFGGGFNNFTPPTTSIPTILIVKDTNSTTPGKRLYVFTGSEWSYVDLT